MQLFSRKLLSRFLAETVGRVYAKAFWQTMPVGADAAGSYQRLSWRSVLQLSARICRWKKGLQVLKETVGGGFYCSFLAESAGGAGG